MVLISRHARRSMSLYGITDADVIAAVEAPDKAVREGDRRFALKEFTGRFGGRGMKVSYDPDVDAAYLRMSNKKPDGAVELGEGVILHTGAKDEIVAIEILDASKRFPVKTLYKLELDRAAG